MRNCFVTLYCKPVMRGTGAEQNPFDVDIILPRPCLSFKDTSMRGFLKLGFPSLCGHQARSQIEKFCTISYLEIRSLRICWEHLQKHSLKAAVEQPKSPFPTLFNNLTLLMLCVSIYHKALQEKRQLIEVLCFIENSIFVRCTVLWKSAPPVKFFFSFFNICGDGIEENKLVTLQLFTQKKN